MENENLQQEEQKQEGQENKQEENKQVETLTLTQSELDKKISEAIKTRETNLNKNFEKKLEEEISKRLEEKKRLSTLSKEEQREEDFKQKEKQLLEKEIKLKNLELKNDLLTELNRLNLPVESLELLLSEHDTDATIVLERINKFKQIIEKSSHDFLASKMKDNALNPNSSQSADTVNLEDYKKMDYKQRTELMQKNKALYEQLSKQLRGL